MTVSERINVVLVDSPKDCDPVRELLRDFVRWHFARHLQDADLINEYFDKKSFDAELMQLPGKYVHPDGALLLACLDGSPAGCVALKKIDDDTCEMKRMFVYEKFHGHGLGRRLATDIVNQARQLGFKKMMLDTSFRQDEAQKLYSSIGFKKCEPYYTLPDRLRDWLVFMELHL